MNTAQLLLSAGVASIMLAFVNFRVLRTRVGHEMLAFVTKTKIPTGTSIPGPFDNK